MRQIVLDTETTGLEPGEGHRIIEIACVEMVNRRLTDRNFHAYLNPDRAIDEGAMEVHGLTNEFLADKPRFADIVDDFLGFVEAAELVIHNAPFDIGFINRELALLDRDHGEITRHCTVLDTLVLARSKHPGQRNSLDALCRRYNIDNSHRQLHGALLDAEILAEVYLVLSGGQISLSFGEEETKDTRISAAAASRTTQRAPLRVIRCQDEELQAHHERLDAIEGASGGKCLWKTP